MKTKFLTTIIIAALLLCENALTVQAQSTRSITTEQGTQVLQAGVTYTLKPDGTGKIILRESGTQKQALTMPANVTFISGTTPDTEPPTVADNTIIISNLTANSVKLSWNAANDNVTETSTLKYKVYYCSGGDMTDIYACENNADGNSGYLTGTTTYTYNGSLNWTISFNVVVEDEAGNKTAYTHKNVRYVAGFSFAADAAIFDQTTGELIGPTAVMNSMTQTRMPVYIGNRNTGTPYSYTDAEWFSSNTSVARIETPTGNGTAILAWSNGASTISVNDKSGNTLSFNLTIQQGGGGTPPTSVSFAQPLIYTYYGEGVPLGMTLTPAGADPALITWTKTSSNANTSAFEYSAGLWWTGVVLSANPGYIASLGNQYATLTATCPNGATAQVELRTRFNMAVSTTASFPSPDWFNIGDNYSWIQSASNKYVRAYYGANQTQWNRSNNIAWDTNLTKINTSMYTITSNDPDITAAPMADGVTWELTRHNFDTLKEVTLTITCGMQSYTQVLTLLR